MPNAPSVGKAWASTARALILASVLCSVGVSAQPRVAPQPRVTHVLRAPVDFQGQVQRVIVDASGVAWIATTQFIYRVTSHGVVDVEPVGGTDERIVMMPGGELYARMIVNKSGGFGVQLRDLNNPGRVIGSLDSPGLPIGFTTLHVGYQGQIIVTSTPLQSAEGLRGTFQFGYWSSKGEHLNDIKLDGPHNGIVNDVGDAILLMGQANAIAFNNRGGELWRHRGAFRKGTLARGGTVALLNPADAIDTISVVKPNAYTSVTLPGPVHELALTPDGSMAAVATDRGKVSILNPASCGPDSCPVNVMPALPIGDTYYISAIRFLDRATLALGVIEASGRPPKVSYTKGHVFVVATDGEVKFQHPIELGPDAGWGPLLEVKFEEPIFSARTSDTVVIVKINGPS